MRLPQKRLWSPSTWTTHAAPLAAAVTVHVVEDRSNGSGRRYHGNTRSRSGDDPVEGAAPSATGCRSPSTPPGSSGRHRDGTTASSAPALRAAGARIEVLAALDGQWRRTAPVVAWRCLVCAFATAADDLSIGWLAGGASLTGEDRRAGAVGWSGWSNAGMAGNGLLRAGAPFDRRARPVVPLAMVCTLRWSRIGCIFTAEGRPVPTAVPAAVACRPRGRALQESAEAYGRPHRHSVIQNHG